MDQLDANAFEASDTPSLDVTATPEPTVAQVEQVIAKISTAAKNFEGATAA